MLYFIRITPQSLDYNVVKVYFKKISSRYAYVKHQGHTSDDRLHYHWIIDTTMCWQTIYNFLKKNQYKGNTYYAHEEIGVLDSDLYNCLAYLMKDGEPYFLGWSEHDLSEAKKVDLTKKSKKKEKPIEVMLRYCQESGVHSCLDFHETKLRIARQVVRYYQENDMIIRRGLIVAYVDTLYLKLYPESSGILISDMFR